MNKRNKKTILVTGGCGFIGSNYLNKFVPKYPNYEFINIDCLTYAGNLKNINIAKEPNYKFKKIDIRNKKSLEKIFIDYKPTDIIHFAAESHVDISIANPSIFIDTNVIGTHNLLLLALKYKINRFHQISTDEVYGSLTDDEPPFTNRSNIAPNSPYSASKAAADLLVRAYNETYKMDVVITRCSNNYGPNQDKTKLIPKAICNLLEGKKVPIYGKGENIRDWIYVEDHIDAIDLVFQKGLSGEIYNIGGNTELKNIDLIKRLIKLTGKTANSIKFVTDRKGHDHRYAIDNSDIEKKLGWRPKFNINDGLEKTLRFYRDNKL